MKSAFPGAEYCKKIVFWSCIAVASLVGAVPDALAQSSWPTKPLRILVGFTAGSGTDTTARLLAQKLTEKLGQSVVVDNRPGAGGAIAANAVAKAPADGYTLLLMSSSGPTLSALRTDIPYDLNRDLAPISLVATGPLVLVGRPTLPASDLKELLALAKAKPDSLTYGSSGIGSAAHLAGELMFSSAGVKVRHVPYKGTSGSTVATVAGQIDMSIVSAAGVSKLLEAGKLRALAVTSPVRSPAFPNVPTVEESGFPGYNRQSWYGLLAPIATPKDIIARLNTAIAQGMFAADTKEALATQGFQPQSSTPEQFGTLIQNTLAQDTKVVKASGMKAE